MKPVTLSVEACCICQVSAIELLSDDALMFSGEAIGTKKSENELILI